jgi:hypothetical protein
MNVAAGAGWTVLYWLVASWAGSDADVSTWAACPGLRGATAAVAAAIKARHVMLVHGQPPGQRKLRRRLQLRSQQTIDTLTWPP